MQVFDASSMVYAWDNYPIEQFPPLWDWIANQAENGQLVMSSVAFREVDDKVPDCGQWLKDNNLHQLEVSNAVLQEAKRIKALLGIVNDKFHSRGVGENDILIIATAKINNIELVSEEERQNIPPQIPAKRKIPSVCSLPSVAVSCINFIEYIKNSGAIFG